MDDRKYQVFLKGTRWIKMAKTCYVFGPLAPRPKTCGKVTAAEARGAGGAGNQIHDWKKVSHLICCSATAHRISFCPKTWGLLQVGKGREINSSRISLGH